MRHSSSSRDGRGRSSPLSVSRQEVQQLPSLRDAIPEICTFNPAYSNSENYARELSHDPSGPSRYPTAPSLVPSPPNRRSHISQTANATSSGYPMSQSHHSRYNGYDRSEMRLPLHSGPPHRSNDSSSSSGYSDSRSTLSSSAVPSVRTSSRYAPSGPRSPDHRSLPSIHNVSHAPVSYSQSQLAPLNQQRVQQSIETAAYPPPPPPPPSSFDPRFASYRYSPADHSSGHLHTRPVEFETVDVGEKSNKKRRGNLPKHTTDILRAWLHDHLEHAYPNEEQKQRLIQQTGLTDKQVSNWFINARRRNVPKLVGQAQAESRLMASQGSSPSDSSSPIKRE